MKVVWIGCMSCLSGVPLKTINLQYCCFYPHFTFSLYNTLTLCTFNSFLLSAVFLTSLLLTHVAGTRHVILIWGCMPYEEIDRDSLYEARQCYSVHNSIEKAITWINQNLPDSDCRDKIILNMPSLFKQINYIWHIYYEIWTSTWQTDYTLATSSANTLNDIIMNA